MPDLTFDIDVAAVRESRVAHLSDYFALWSVETDCFLSIVQRVETMDLASHVRQGLTMMSAGERREMAARTDVTVRGGERGDTSQKIAVIDINGAMMKFTSSLDSDAVSTVQVRRELRAAARDDEVAGILLRIDSPGGTVSGTDDLARDVVDAASRKPVHAFVEDLGASAAYWVASQAGRITVNSDTAKIGSIGTFASIMDLSGYAAKEGIKVLVFKSGRLKGMGTPGTEITAEQQARIQQLVLETQTFFSAAVKRGRRMTDAQVQELVDDGGVFMAGDALKRGMVDAIGPFDAAVADLIKAIDGSRAKSSSTSRADARPLDTAATSTDPITENAAMSDKTTDSATDNKTNAAAQAPQAATFEQLKAQCIGADAEFIVEQLGKKATIEQARTAWMETQQARIESRDKQIEDAKTKTAAPGNKAVTEAGKGTAPEASSENPADDWNDAVAAKVKAGLPRAKAIAAVNRENPGLREQMLKAHNQAHGRAVA